MTGGLQENKEYRKGGIWDWRDTGKEGNRKEGFSTEGTGGIQDRWDAGQFGCRTGRMQERREAGRRDAGQEGGRKGGRHERMDAGNE